VPALPGARSFEIVGYRGYVLRRDLADEAEFVVINRFDSSEAIRVFAGPDYAVATFESEGKKLLAKVEEFALHFEVCATPSQERLEPVSCAP
jgi:hypothetical protein